MILLRCSGLLRNPRSLSIAHTAGLADQGTLYEATRKNAVAPNSKRIKWHAGQLHDFVLFMANTGLRPNEVRHLQFRDVAIVKDEWSGDRILEIEVRGKRGVGYPRMVATVALTKQIETKSFCSLKHRSLFHQSERSRNAMWLAARYPNVNDDISVYPA